jgi:GT2 family glycosyltransferase
MNPVQIVIPTLDPLRADRVGKQATAAAGLRSHYEVLHDRTHQGFTATCNRAPKVPSADMCLLNDDVADFPTGWLKALSEVLYSEPDIGMVGPAGDRSTAYNHDWTPQDSGLQEVEHLSFWCVLIRRDVIDRIGMLDPRLIHYASDFDYCDRAHEAGWRCIWDKDVILTHAGTASGTIKAWRAHDLSLYQYIRRRRVNA